MSAATLSFVTATDPEWERAWGEVARYFGDQFCTDPASRESWQYMGSTERAHEFRHRALPTFVYDHAGNRRVVRTARTYFYVPLDAARAPWYHDAENTPPR